MYKHILIPTDGSELATKGLLHGLALAKNQGAAVTIVTVTELWSALAMTRQIGEGADRYRQSIGRYEEQAATVARTILDKAVKLAQTQGINAETLHVADQHPAEGIIATSKDKGCDLIVMASHGRRGLSRLMLGSQAYEVLSHSTVPVLVVR
jgi:nucleotide-binding universal stress UspA family protein